MRKLLAALTLVFTLGAPGATFAQGDTPHVRGVHAFRCTQDYGQQFIIARIDFDAMRPYGGTLETADSRRSRNPPFVDPHWAMTCQLHYG